MDGSDFFGVKLVSLVLVGSLMLIDRWLVCWLVVVSSFGDVLGMVLRWM